MSGLLEQVIDEVSAAPRSAAALTLYALVSTLEFERAGCLFKLVKLRDLSDSQRQLAYRLMDLLAVGANTGMDWEAAKQRMDELVRGG